MRKYVELFQLYNELSTGAPPPKARQRRDFIVGHVAIA
jgi:hypothetical protein